VPADHGPSDPLDPTALPRIHLEQLAEIGRDQDGSSPLLSKVTAAAFLGSGDFAVASDEGEILVFAARGELFRTLGRAGDGPGEFRFIRDLVGLADERIVAWDPALDRVTAFARDGSLAFTCTPPWARSKQAGVGFVGAFADGRFVLEDMSARPTDEGVGGFRSDTIPYLLFDRSGTLVRTIATFARPLRPYDARTGYRPFLFATSVQSRIVGDQLYVGENASLTLERFDSTGIAHTPVRLERAPRRVTALDIEAGWRAWGERTAMQHQQLTMQTAVVRGERAAADLQRRTEEAIARAKETTEPAEFLPAYKAIIVGSDHALWLEDYLHPTEDVSRWFLMSDDFRPVAWIALPPRERLLAAAPGRLIVLRRDELDVESAVVYGGDWPPAGRRARERLERQPISVLPVQYLGRVKGRHSRRSHRSRSRCWNGRPIRFDSRSPPPASERFHRSPVSRATAMRASVTRGCSSGSASFQRSMNSP